MSFWKWVFEGIRPHLTNKKLWIYIISWMGVFWFGFKLPIPWCFLPMIIWMICWLLYISYEAYLRSSASTTKMEEC